MPRGCLLPAALCHPPQIMLGPHNLCTKAQWLDRARVWRLIFLVRPDGSWDASETPGVAFALQAQRVRPQDVKKITRKERSAWQSALVKMATDAEVMDAADEVEGGVSGTAGVCPLTGMDARAVEWSAPEALRRVAAEEGTGEPFPLVRAWVRAHTGPPSDARGNGLIGRPPALRAAVCRPRPSLSPQTTILAVQVLRCRAKSSWLLHDAVDSGFDETIVARCPMTRSGRALLLRKSFVRSGASMVLATCPPESPLRLCRRTAAWHTSIPWRAPGLPTLRRTTRAACRSHSQPVVLSPPPPPHPSPTISPRLDPPRR